MPTKDDIHMKYVYDKMLKKYYLPRIAKFKPQ